MQRQTDPAHGAPEDVSAALRVQKLLRSDGPHAPATVRRRLASWSILTRWRGLKGEFSKPSPKSVLRLSVRAAARPRKSNKAVTGDVLAQLLLACAGERLVNLRDRALLLLAFASGGSRRSEVSGLRVEDCDDEALIPADPKNPESTHLPCLTLHLGRTKTTMIEDEANVVLIDRPVTALRAWLEKARIGTGSVFRKTFRGTACDRDIRQRPPIVAFPCPRPCSSRSTGRSLGGQ